MKFIKGLPMDVAVVLTVGLNGSLVVVVTTGGNSPLAERENDAFNEKTAFFPPCAALESC